MGRTMRRGLGIASLALVPALLSGCFLDDAAHDAAMVYLDAIAEGRFADAAAFESAATLEAADSTDTEDGEIIDGRTDDAARGAELISDVRLDNGDYEDDTYTFTVHYTLGGEEYRDRITMAEADGTRDYTLAAGLTKLIAFDPRLAEEAHGSFNYQDELEHLSLTLGGEEITYGFFGYGGDSDLIAVYPAIYPVDPASGPYLTAEAQSVTVEQIGRRYPLVYDLGQRVGSGTVESLERMLRQCLATDAAQTACDIAVGDATGPVEWSLVGSPTLQRDPVQTYVNVADATVRAEYPTAGGPVTVDIPVRSRVLTSIITPDAIDLNHVNWTMHPLDEEICFDDGNCFTW